MIAEGSVVELKDQSSIECVFSCNPDYISEISKFSCLCGMPLKVVSLESDFVRLSVGDLPYRLSSRLGLLEGNLMIHRNAVKESSKDINKFVIHKGDTVTIKSWEKMARQYKGDSRRINAGGFTFIKSMKYLCGVTFEVTNDPSEMVPSGTVEYIDGYPITYWMVEKTDGYESSIEPDTGCEFHCTLEDSSGVNKTSIEPDTGCEFHRTLEDSSSVNKTYVGLEDSRCFFNPDEISEFIEKCKIKAFEKVENEIVNQMVDNIKKSIRGLEG